MIQCYSVRFFFCCSLANANCMTNRKIIAMSSANNWNLLLLFPAIKAPKSTVMLCRFAVNLISMSYTYNNDRWMLRMKRPFQVKKINKQKAQRASRRETNNAKKNHFSSSDKDFAQTKRVALLFLRRFSSCAVFRSV